MPNANLSQLEMSIDEVDAREIIASLPLTSITITEMSLNVINFFILPYFFIRIRYAKMIHRNLRTMLMSLSVALGLFNVTRFWDGILHFMLASFNFVQRHVAIYNRQCWFIRFVYDTSMNVFAITMMCMAIERIISTIAVKHYEQRESIKISILIVVLQWLIATIATLYFQIDDFINTLRTNWNSSEVQLTCSLIYIRPTIVLIGFIIGFSGFAIFTLILFVLYRYNSTNYKERTLVGLNVRYQLVENINTLRFLLPLVLLFGILYGSSLIVVIFVESQIMKDPEVNLEALIGLSLGVKLVNIPGSIYTLLYCCICLLLHTPLRKTVKDDFARISGRLTRKQPESELNNGKINNIDEGEIYFRNIQRAWR